jgi:hypothetical protein
VESTVDGSTGAEGEATPAPKAKARSRGKK